MANFQAHVYLNSVQQMVSGELAGEGLQTRFSRHGLPPQRAPLDTVYPLREHLKKTVSSEWCPEGTVRVVSRHGLLDTVKKHMVDVPRKFSRMCIRICCKINS